MKRVYGILRFLDDIFSRFTDALIIMALLIAVYLFIDTKIIFDGVSANKITQYKPESSQASRELVGKYKDYVFWLCIDDSAVDFPVVQGATNADYLNKSPDGQYSLSGSIFLDSNNSSDLTDEYSILYGHHMQQKQMFGSLDDFADKKFFETHRLGYFLMKDGTWIEFETFAFGRTTTDERAVFTIDYPVDRVEWARDNAKIFMEPPSGDGNVVALTTCVSPSSTDRWYVFVKITDILEAKE